MVCKTYRWNGETTTYLRHLEYFVYVIHYIYYNGGIFWSMVNKFVSVLFRYLNIDIVFLFQLNFAFSNISWHSMNINMILSDLMWCPSNLIHYLTPRKNTTSQPWENLWCLAKNLKFLKFPGSPVYLCHPASAKDKVTVGDYDLISYAHNKNCKAFSSNFLAGRKCLGFGHGDGWWRFHLRPLLIPIQYCYFIILWNFIKDL